MAPSKIWFLLEDGLQRDAALWLACWELEDSLFQSFAMAENTFIVFLSLRDYDLIANGRTALF